MPLLKREVDLFPSHLFELAAEEFPWWIAHVRSRQEKVAARHAAVNGVPFYLPQMEKTIRRRGRAFRSFLPLFSGYLFLRGHDEMRPVMYRSGVIVGRIRVIDQELLTRELRQLHELQRAGASLKAVPDYKPGDIVRVIEGPFRGYEGAVVRGKGKLRLIVQVTTLHRAVLVELESDSIVPSCSRVFGGHRQLGVA